MTNLESCFPERSRHLWLQPGRYAEAYTSALAELERRRAVRRIWEQDAALWRKEPEHLAEISRRLGWLHLHQTMQPHLDALRAFASGCRANGLKRAIHLGMGGSSLAPEVLRQVLDVAPGSLDLVVLDSTDPAQIKRTEHEHTLAETLFIVASKSGTTAETANLYTYFRARVAAELGESAVSRHFCVITDPLTALEVLARDEGLPLFTNPPDIGGRFSALSLFGLLPAALIGADLEHLLFKAAGYAQACGEAEDTQPNPGLQLGTLLGALAALDNPCDKLTLLCSPELTAFGSWVEQLVAESTGKDGVGILPVTDELLAPESYGGDRVFAYLRLERSDNQALDATVSRLVETGAPCVVLPLDERYDLAGQFFLWEFATAVAGAVLRINPFDQPNVESAKVQARAALARFEETRTLDIGVPSLQDGSLLFYGPEYPVNDAGGYLDCWLAQPPDHGYLAVMAYIDRSPVNEQLLQMLRRRIWKRTGLAVTVGFGPRFLHSTGQLHKGGSKSGMYLQIVQQESDDLPIPGRSYTFGILKRSQALGDLAALRAASRNVICVDIGIDVKQGLESLIAAVEQ